MRGQLTVGRIRQLRGWDAAVAASAVVLLAVVSAFGIAWLVSRESRATMLTVAAPVSAVQLDLSSGDADVVGGGPTSVELRRTDGFAFGRSPHEQRSLDGGVLRVSSSCPKIVVGTCSSSYRVVVPDGVAVSVRTGGGSVHLGGFRGNARISTGSGSITVDAFCGFTLSALSRGGAVHVATACAPKSITLSSRRGDVTALVPPGRYRVHASSGAGRTRVSGVTSSDKAPFTISASSGAGSATVEGGL